MVLVPGPEPAIEVRASRLASCDLSGVPSRPCTAASLGGCKLAGTDLSAALVTDHQLPAPALAPVLATAVGLDPERDREAEWPEGGAGRA